jgi:hypothetical protein
MKRRRIIKGTSSADLAEVGTGYRANGEGQYTRRAAHGDRMAVEVDTVDDLFRRLRRAKARHGNHRDAIVRRRAGQDMIELKFQLRRLGHVV